MFSNQGSDEGCGKWLTTKNTKRIAHSVKQKNARGAKKGRKKFAAIKSDHLPGVVISSTPMSPRIIEMLSRVRQAKVERFFKPVTSKDKEDKRCESSEEYLVKNDDGSLGKEVLRSYTTPILKRQHKMTTDQEELQLWDDDDITSNEIHQNETDKLNISGVSSIEKSNNDSPAQGLHLSNATATNQHEPVINSSPDDIIKSPVSKKFRSMTDEPPTSPSSPFPNSFNDDDEKDSDSFHYTQWVNEQKRKSKELQDDSPVSSQQRTKLESSGRSSSSSSTDLERKCSLDIGYENFLDTESQFRFSQWALEQKAKCKSLQNDSHEILSGPRDKDESLYKNLKESKSSGQDQSYLDWTESNFQFTEWVREQKKKSKEIQHSSPESKKVLQTCDGTMIGSWDENDVCIPESEVFEGVESGVEWGWQYQKKGCKKGETEKISKRDYLRSSYKNLSSREALKDVSNEVMCSNGTSSKIAREQTEEEASHKMNSPSQESEYFQYTEWTRNQREICKQIHKEPDLPHKDDFWDIPTVKNDRKPANECQEKENQLVLASDTDQESDSETSFLSLQN